MASILVPQITGDLRTKYDHFSGDSHELEVPRLRQA